MTLIAQLSDLHIREPGRLAYERLDTAPYLRAAVEAIARLPQVPDAVLITGDLTDFGRPQEYRHLAELLAPLRQPVFLLPGNHDEAQALRAAFPGHTYLGAEGDVCYSVPVGDLQLIAVDSTVARASHGQLDAARLDWVQRALAAAGTRPVLLALHHPPFRTLIGHMDEIGLLAGAGELEALVSRHSNVERVLCGHLHRPIDVRFGGTMASTCPSPAHQVVLDLDVSAPSQWNLEPGAFKLHAWNPGRGIVTHQAYVGSFAGPYPFHADGELID